MSSPVWKQLKLNCLLKKISRYQSKCVHWIFPVQVAEWLPLSQASLLGNKISPKTPAISHQFCACWGKVQHKPTIFTKGKENKKIVMSQPCPDCFFKSSPIFTCKVIFRVSLELLIFLMQFIFLFDSVSVSQIENSFLVSSLTWF